MKIGTNLMALQTSADLNSINNQLSKSSERLSSGKRLNTAADGGAAVAMISKMKIKHLGVEVANRNTADATSLVQTADTAMTQIRDLVQRIRELSIQAGNDTLADTDREKIQGEINHYKEEITGIANRTEFNGIKIFSGEADNILTPIVPAGSNDYIRVAKVTDTVQTGEYSFNLPLAVTSVPTLLPSVSGTAEYTYDGDTLTITDVDNRKIILDMSNLPAGATGTYGLKIEQRGLVFQVGSDKGMETRINIPKICTETLELDAVNVMTWQGADEAIAACDKALEDITRYGARIGAYINRMEYTNYNLESTSLNLEESMSSITDTDMAREMVNYTRAQILAQADISMLAQANQRPQQLLQLFQR